MSEPNTDTNAFYSQSVPTEPKIGSQYTDAEGDIWGRQEDGGWYCWDENVRKWSQVRQPTLLDVYLMYGPLRPTTPDDRIEKGLDFEKRVKHIRDMLDSFAKERGLTDDLYDHIDWLLTCVEELNAFSDEILNTETSPNVKFASYCGYTIKEILGAK